MRINKHWAWLLIALVLGCQPRYQQAEWGVYQEPVTPGQLPRDAGVAELSSVWRRDIGSGAEAGYAILRAARGRYGISSVSRRGRVALYQSETGQPRWSIDLKRDIFAGVAAADGMLVVAQDNGVLVALNEADGKVIWRVTIKRPVSALAAIGRGRVVIRTTDGLIVGLNAANGKRVWALGPFTPGLGVHGDSTPVIVADAVLLGLPNGQLMVNNVLTGHAHWQADLALSHGRNALERISDADTAPLVAGDRVFAAAYQGNVAAFDLATATLLWKTKLSTRLPLSLAQSRLFVTDEFGNIVALHAATGEVLWRQDSLQGRGVSHPLALSGRVLVGDAAGNVHSLEATSGTLLQTLKVTRGALLSLIPNGDQIAVFSSKGELVSLSLKRG